MAIGRSPEEPQNHTTPLRRTNRSRPFPAGNEDLLPNSGGLALEIAGVLRNGSLSPTLPATRYAHLLALPLPKPEVLRTGRISGPSQQRADAATQVADARRVTLLDPDAEEGTANPLAGRPGAPQNPEVRFPERSWQRKNRQVRHGEENRSARGAATAGVARAEKDRPPGLDSATRTGADGPNKTTPPCRKSLACPKVATSVPENRKPWSNPRPW
jgi:hypothetical protein